RGFIIGEAQVPSILMGTVDGVFRKATQHMGLQVTGGSASIRFTGELTMRVAGAAAKAMLLSAAARAWQTDSTALSVADSVIHGPDGKRATFGEFATAAVAEDMPAHPVLKSPEQFRLIGRSVPRFDLPAKVDGTAKFGIDVSIPNMQYAAIQAAPVFGAAPKTWDREAMLNAAGVSEVVELPSAVAVVASSYWHAQQAFGRANLSFSDTGLESVNSESLMRSFRNSLDTDKPAIEVSAGDAATTLSASNDVISAEYTVPFLAHATMEPMNCTAHFFDNACELWTGTQNPLGLAYEVAAALDIDNDRVTVNNHTMGGGFGRRAIADYAVQAALISRAVGTPVKLIWSREEDVQQDHYRPAAVSRFKAALGADGRPVAWQNYFVFQHDPKDASHIPYAIDNQRIGFTEPDMHIRFGPWRSVDHSQHGFFVESFIDELAVAANRDPYEYRRELLAHEPRYLKVLDTAARFAGWGRVQQANEGLGIAIRKSFGTIVAQVAHVAVNRSGIQVKKIVCAADAGIAVNPDSFVAQMESGIIYGMTAAMYGNIEIEQGRVIQSNFHDYQTVRMNDAPDIETYIINGGGATGGAGEPGTPPIAPAIANAVFAATGERIRNLPMNRHRFDLG
ncbi:MAG: xanthine dehydrogenase family protein molybdopterin-binding subunit, partial [Gammaproteobacteria bacterium]|nr:xanthine dehydrogenase family protein molybdopterin-binding subunit [Gammaproteobacteria bacterium]